MVCSVCQRNSLTTSTFVKMVVLMVLLSLRVTAEQSYKEDFDPDTSLEEYIDKPSYTTNQNLLWHLLRASTLGQAGDVISHAHNLKTKAAPLKKNVDGMSLEDLAEYLSDLKERFGDRVSMRMPSLRFG